MAVAHYKNILFYADPVTESQPARRYAARLAKRSGGSVTIIDCVEKPSSFVRRLLPSTWDLEEVIAQDHQQRLEKIAEEFRAEGIPATTKIVHGRPAEELTREAIRAGHDVVIKTARGAGGRKESGLFGAVAIRLMRICPCPVCVVDPSEDERFDRILATVDAQAHDPLHLALNDKILKTALDLADEEQGELHVLHAWTAYAEDVLTARMSDEQIAEYLDNTRAAAQKKLDELTAPLADRIPRERIHLFHGDPDRVITEFTHQCKMDLVVLGTTGRRGLQGALMGNIAEMVVHRVRCSVLALKPDGFVSPLARQEEQRAAQPATTPTPGKTASS